jgi:hypothetical protein
MLILMVFYFSLANVAQQRFANAKAISSDQYFGYDKKNNDPDKEAKMAKFAGARAISSADYFNRDEGSAAGMTKRKMKKVRWYNSSFF